MAGYSREQLVEALRKADKAGDTKAAQAIANRIRSMDAQGVKDNRPTSFWQGVKDELGKAASNAAWVGDVWSGRYLTGRLTGQPQPNDIARAQVRRSSARSPVRASTAGSIVGGVLGSLPTAFIGGPVMSGAIGGLALAEDPNDPLKLARDVAVGAVGGKAGDLVGRRVVAPVAERLGRTAPARFTAKQVAKAVSAVSGQAPRVLPNPRLTRAERMTASAAPDLGDVRQRLVDADSMGLPYALADADPRLRSVAGSITRYSPDARAMAETNFVPRAAGQADRAIAGIDENLAPITNIEQRGKDLIQQGRDAARPFYDAARSRAAPVDEEIAAMLQTPAGQEALGVARSIAANEGRDPNTLGFDLNEQGQTIIRELPSFETLQYVKRGLDSVVEGKRNAFGQLDLSGDPALQAVNKLRGRFNERLGELNPDYAAGNEAYRAFAKQRDALNMGYEVLPQRTLPQRQFDAAVSGLTPETMPEAQRGLATAMADTVNAQALSRNPYNAIYGSPAQRAKVETMFPGGSQRFGQLYDMEADMAKTMTETLGGSQTQPRAMADAMFENDAANTAGGFAVDAMTGNAPGIARRIAQAVVDRGRMGLVGGERRAREMAPLFLGTDTRATIDAIDELTRRMAEQEMRTQAYRRVGGIFGAPAGVASSLALFSE